MATHESDAVVAAGDPPIMALLDAARVAHEVDDPRRGQVAQQEQAARDLLVRVEHVRLAGFGRDRPRQSLGHRRKPHPLRFVRASEPGRGPAADVGLPAAECGKLVPIQALGLEAPPHPGPERAIAHRGPARAGLTVVEALQPGDDLAQALDGGPAAEQDAEDGAAAVAAAHDVEVQGFSSSRRGENAPRRSRTPSPPRWRPGARVPPRAAPPALPIRASRLALPARCRLRMWGGIGPRRALRSAGETGGSYCPSRHGAQPFARRAIRTGACLVRRRALGQAASRERAEAAEARAASPCPPKLGRLPAWRSSAATLLQLRPGGPPPWQRRPG